jgi:hypothetical protein
MNPSSSSTSPHDHPEAWLDALLHADAAQESAALGEADAAFGAALLARLPQPQLAPALRHPLVPRPYRLLGPICACALAIVAALLSLTLPDLLTLLAALPSIDSGGAALLSLPLALPSLALLSLLCWWSWLVSREA